LQELATRKNSLPLPLISDTKAKILLPPEQHCLLSASYKITATVTNRNLNEFFNIFSAANSNIVINK
jgi:hypothetical protein